jgi:ParB/RepB/Spo0J family partition protein
MKNSIKSIPLEKLIAHPDNPNRQSKATFARLVRNIDRTGRYEPLVVRPHPTRKGFYEIINGHHRCRALAQLGYERADAVAWDVDDEQVDILLATLNRLGGTDDLAGKLRLLKRLSGRFEPSQLARLVPNTKKQIERLTSLKLPGLPAKIDAAAFAAPMVFFLSGEQQRIVQQALSQAEADGTEKTMAARKASALTALATCYIDVCAR